MTKQPKLDIGDNTRKGLIELHHAIAKILNERGYRAEVYDWYPTLRVWIQKDHPDEVRWNWTTGNKNFLVWWLENWTDKMNWDGAKVEIYKCVFCSEAPEIHANAIEKLFPYSKWMHTGMDVESDRMKACGLT